MKHLMEINKNTEDKYLRNYCSVISGLEKKVFSPEYIDEPSESSEGIEKFIKAGGIVYLLEKDGFFVGFYEMINLEDLNKIKPDKFTKDSPLKAILENKKVLYHVKKLYSNANDKDIIYVHGYGLVPEEPDRLLIKEFLNISKDSKREGKKVFAFVKPDNINSLKFFFHLDSKGHFIAKNVYGRNEYYLMIGSKNT